MIIPHCRNSEKKVRRIQSYGVTPILTNILNKRKIEQFFSVFMYTPAR